MAVCGIGLRAGPGSFQVQLFGGNLSTRLTRPACDSQRKSLKLTRRRSGKVYFSSSGESVTPLDYEENDSVPGPSLTDEDLGHVMKFKMSDFKICKTVSVGLGGRSDEVVFEAMVNDSHSPLYNTRVVLRQLITPQAQRRGQRALKVLKKLARRRLLYHSYSMQVHGYISMPNDLGSFTLVHGYHGSFSLRHWLQLSDWLPTLEATLALDEESVRKVGDDTVGGPAISRQLRLIRILMRDLLIGVNYLHSHGLAHTELRLENVHVSPVDGHIKVGILGNASDFYEDSRNNGMLDMERRRMMIAFDMRCVGFMLAKMVLRELMDPLIFAKFKSLLTKGNDPSCLREYLMQILNTNSATGNSGLQILDRNWGAGWNLLSLLLSNSPSKRISCLEALRHPFLCGPRWRVEPSMEIIRWGLGSTAVRITEEYIYRQPQRTRVAHLIELMETLNPHSRPRDWLELLPGRWRLLYSTGRHIGLTIRQPSARALIGSVHLTITRASKMSPTLSLSSNVGFTVMLGRDWPHSKAGTDGKLQVNSSLRLMAGRRLYVIDETATSNSSPMAWRTQDSVTPRISDKRWKKTVPFVEFPSSLPVAKLLSSEVEVLMSLGEPLTHDVNNARKVIQEVRTQIPPEMFDVSRLVCGTYIDTRLLVVRGVSGSALLFTRSCEKIT